MEFDLKNYKPKKPFSQKHLLGLQDYSADEIYQILCLALKLKDEKKQGISHPHLKDKTLGMIFTKSSTRTRVSFETGMVQLGGYPLFLNSSDLQLGRGETIEDTARVLSRYLDCIMIRTYKQRDVDDLARFGDIPIINALTDLLHPCQVLADLMTIYEKKGRLSGLKLCYIGDGNNMANSLLVGCSKMGMDISIGCPDDYQPDRNILESSMANARESGASITITNNPMEAADNGDVIYTDVWASMGQESQSQKRLQAFAPYQVNTRLFSAAKKDAIFLHCLPAHRGEEVTTDIIDGPMSSVFDQAENRLHVQKAVMVLLIKQAG